MCGKPRREDANCADLKLFELRADRPDPSNGGGLLAPKNQPVGPCSSTINSRKRGKQESWFFATIILPPFPLSAGVSMLAILIRMGRPRARGSCLIHRDHISSQRLDCRGDTPYRAILHKRLAKRIFYPRMVVNTQYRTLYRYSPTP